MAKLKKITIKGFKSIRELNEFELRDLNILIGPNGAGKSNFIGAFKLLNQIVEKNLQVYVGQCSGGDKLLYLGSANTEYIHIHLWFGRNGYSAKLAPTSDDSLFFEDETTYYLGAGYTRPYEQTLGSGHKETLLHEKAAGGERIPKYVLDSLTSWRLYHFHDTSDSAKIKKTNDIDDNSFLRHDASNLAPFLYLLKKTKVDYYNNIVDTIHLVAPFFDDFDLKPSSLNQNKIKLEWKQRGTDAYFDASSLSDGTLRFICLATLLLQPDLPTTVLIDEPELGLHPYAISMLAELVKSAAEKTQIIVSTQSVTLVNQFNLEDLIIVEMENNETTLKRLPETDISEWIGEYALGDLWEKNVLGGRPK